MGTDKRQLIAYVSDQLYQALEQYRGTYGHKSLSIAIAAILDSALLGESDGKAVDNSGELLSDLLARLDVIERRLSQLESKALTPVPTPPTRAAIATGGGEWLTPGQAYEQLARRGYPKADVSFRKLLARSREQGTVDPELMQWGVVADFDRFSKLNNRSAWLKINPPQSE